MISTISTARGAAAWLSLLAATILLLTGCPDDDPAPEETPEAPEASPTPEEPEDAPDDPPPPSDDELTAPPALDVEIVVDGLSELTDLTAPAGDDRLFVAERHGTVRIVDDGEIVGEPFLDLADRVTTQGQEQGLLGIAFHPDDPDRVFAHYSGQGGRTVLAEYALSGDERVDLDSEQILLTVDQPARNHNGGRIDLGPDGMLYLALGDGGGGSDQFGHGQDPTTLLGTIVRLDVSTPGEARVPEDNPFADGQGGAPEVWAYGLRNPFRFAFDEDLMYIADVGQNAWEWVNIVPADEAGSNHGWSITEGSNCFDPPTDCPTDGLVEPALEYPNEGSDCAIIGGFVYRGDAIEGLQGHYLYADLCGGWLRSFAFDPETSVVDFETEHIDAGGLGSVYSFGEDGHGEVYVLTGAGEVHRIVGAG